MDPLARADDASLARRRSHPLVTMIACDHVARARRERRSNEGARAMDADAIDAIDDDGDATRATASDARAIDAVVGVIYGVFSSDGGVECVTCAETRAVRDDERGGGWMFDWDAVARRDALAAQTRDDLRVVGWYRAIEGECDACGDAEDARAHDALTTWVANAPDGNGDGGTGQDGLAFLAVRVGEEGDAGVTTTTWYEREGDGFVEREHAMETSESERIVVHEVANIAPEGGESHAGRFGASLESAAAATRALRDRLAIVSAHLRAMKAGEVEMDLDVLREVAGAIDALRASSSEAAAESFADEFRDTLALNYLAAATKVTNGLNEFIDKHNVVSGNDDGFGGFGAGGRFHSRRGVGAHVSS